MVPEAKRGHRRAALKGFDIEDGNDGDGNDGDRDDGDGDFGAGDVGAGDDVEEVNDGANDDDVDGDDMFYIEDFCHIKLMFNYNYDFTEVKVNSKSN